MPHRFTLTSIAVFAAVLGLLPSVAAGASGSPALRPVANAEISADRSALLIGAHGAFETRPAKPHELWFHSHGKNYAGFEQFYVDPSGNPIVADSGTLVPDTSMVVASTIGCAPTCVAVENNGSIDAQITGGSVTVLLPYGSSPAAATANSFIGMGGVYNTTLPTPANAQFSPLQTDASGRLIAVATAQFGTSWQPALGTAPAAATVCTNLVNAPVFVFEVYIVAASQQPAGSTLVIYDANAADACPVNNNIYSTGQAGAGQGYPIFTYMTRGLSYAWTSSGVVGGARFSVTTRVASQGG